MTTEPIKPPVVTSADNTVLVLFPPDVLESTKPVVGGDCGVSIRIYDLSPMGARVRVDSYLGQEPNDTVALNLNGQPNIASTQTASTDDSVFMYISKKLLRPEFVNRLTYTVTRRSQNIGTSEPPLEILYNAIRPGIEDRIHGDDGHSELELILPRDVLDDGIDADRAAQGVQVCFSYPYCRAYDKIWLNCNGQDVYRDVTAAEAPAIPSAEPTRICVTVDKAVFERAGDHPQFVFSYTVTDQLGNGPDTDSPWSLSLLVDVYLKTNRLVAPDMAEDPDDPGDDPKTIDLNKLGSKDLTVLVHAFAPLWQPDDIIRVKYSATPTTGAVVEHSVEATVLRIPFTHKLMVPNAKVIAESTVRAMYELVRGGEVIASSRNATARVVGESKIEINAPTLVPPATSPIDPLAHPSGVQVQVEFSGASPGDEARLVAVNALPGSLPFSMLPLDPDYRAVFTLDAAFLGLWHGKQPQLRWDLIRNGEVIAQSSALVLTINRIAHEDPRLLMPVIVGHTGQMLDVAKLLATDKLSIPQWPLQTKDMPVWLRFDGILADGQSDFRIIWDGQVHKFEPSDLVISLTAALVNWLNSLKDDSEVTITFAVNFDKVVDGVAAVRFLVRRYTVKSALDLKPPSIKQAPDNILKPIDADKSLTVLVKQYTGMDLAHKIIVEWKGIAEEGSLVTKPVGVGKIADLEIAIDNWVVAFNLGKRVTVRYGIIVGDAEPQWSEPLSLDVLPIPDESPDWPTPTVPQSPDQKVLDLSKFEGDAAAKCIAWPLIRAKQRIWLRCYGTKADNSPYIIELAKGIEINDTEAGVGLDKIMLLAELKLLKDNSELRIELKVSFDGSSAEAATVKFAGLVLTVKVLPALVVVPSSVSLSGANVSIAGAGLDWILVLDPEDTFASLTITGGTPPYFFKPSEPLIASVDNNGIIRSEGNGKTTIRVFDDSGASETVEVNVTNVTRILHNPSILTPAEVVSWLNSVGGAQFPDDLNSPVFKIVNSKYGRVPGAGVGAYHTGRVRPHNHGNEHQMIHWSASSSPNTWIIFWGYHTYSPRGWSLGIASEL
jgi:hypothetical protein